MNTVIRDIVAKYIATKPDSYILTTGNVIADLNLNSDEMNYDDPVCFALSTIYRKGKECGANKLTVIDTNRKYSRRGNMAANLYRIVRV